MPNSIPVLSVLAILFSAGCVRHHDEHGAHGHEHDEELKTLQLTYWSDRSEVFLEHPLPVTGQPTEFLVHITDLLTLEARTRGSVFLRASAGTSGPDPLEALVEAPSRPGIYQLELTFPKEGEWSVSLSILGDGEQETFALPPLQVYATEHQAHHAKPPEPPEGITLLKEQQWLLGLKTELPQSRSLTERIQVFARVRARPGSSATVLAPLAGQLSAPPERTIPLPGTPVTKGDWLASIQPRFSEAAARLMELEGDFARAKAELRQAESMFKRTQALAESQARSQRELQEAEVALAVAQARFSAAAALRSTFSPSEGQGTAMALRAPISGILADLKAGALEPVQADQPIFTIVDPSSVWIEALVPESAINRIHNAAGALCEMLDSDELFDLSTRGGKKISIGLEIDQGTRALSVLYELANTTPPVLRVGQAVRLHIESATPRTTVAIPYSALVEEGGLFVAYVQVAGETFQKRELRLGIRDGHWIEVLAGLRDGDRVVTHGAYTVRLASATGALPAHGHTH